MNLDKNYIPPAYNFSQVCLTQWLTGFSKILNVEPRNSKIEYPDKFASGFAKLYNIEPGLIYRIVDYTINTDFTFTREPSENFLLLIYFYQYTNAQKLSISINNEIIQSEEDHYSTVLMTNSFASQRVELKKNTIVKGLTIQLSEEWLKEKIENPETFNYQVFKQKNIFKNFLSAKSQKLLNEIFADNSESPTPVLYMNTRVLRLLEEFLKNFLSLDLSENPLSLSTEDFQRILKIEAILLANYASHFPKIENLARIALMSETKLKNIFKKAFGMGLYEYYQKNRMHKAKELLTLNKYSVTEVGSMIGYQNLSNFSNAFKKEFGHLPKNCRKIG